MFRPFNLSLSLVLSKYHVVQSYQRRDSEAANFSRDLISLKRDHEDVTRCVCVCVLVVSAHPILIIDGTSRVTALQHRADELDGTKKSLMMQNADLKVDLHREKFFFHIGCVSGHLIYFSDRETSSEKIRLLTLQLETSRLERETLSEKHANLQVYVCVCSFLLTNQFGKIG